MELDARDSEMHNILSRGQSIGLAFDTEAGVLSAVAAAVILIFIIRRIHKDGWSSWEALDISVIALFLGLFLSGIGHAMDLKWVIEGKVDTGTFCTVQGILRQLGATSVALSTLTIAVQTFLTIWWLKYLNRTISVIVVGVEFLFIILFVAIGFGVHTRAPKEYYATPTPYWCWLGKGFDAERIAGEYFWFWLALFVSLALYPPLFLLYRGVIAPGTSWYSPKADLTRPSQDGTDHGHQRHQHPDPGNPSTRQCGHAEEPSGGISPRNPKVLSRRDPQLWSTILYPTLYCIVVMPLSVVRWISFKEEESSNESHHRPVATFIVIFISGLHGLFNALLYALTRTRFFWSAQKAEPGAPAIKLIPVKGDASDNSIIESVQHS